jgi:hypothetical protein
MRREKHALKVLCGWFAVQPKTMGSLDPLVWLLLVLVLVLVVVVDPSTNQQTNKLPRTKDDDDDHDEHEHEHEHEEEGGLTRNGLSKRSTSVNSKQNVQP